MCDRADDEQGSKAMIQKKLREVTNQMQELQEDLDQEKEARTKAEKQKRDLNEVRLLGLLSAFSVGCYTPEWNVFQPL